MAKISKICGGASMISNEKYQIKEINMYPIAICFCPLGDDWYKNKFQVRMQPNLIIPNYCDIEEWLDDNIRGKSLIIEDAVNLFYNYLIEEYKPVALEIKSHVEDAKHFPVEVTK